MRHLPIVSRSRGPVLVLLAVVLFLAVDTVPAYAAGPKIHTKLTSHTSIRLPSHGAYYLYGLSTDGSAASSGLQDGLYSVTDADGYASAAIAAGPSTTNSYSTTATSHELVGVRIPTAYSQVTEAGDSTDAGPGSSLSASVSFSVADPDTIIEVIGLGSGQQSSSLTGIPGLRVQRSSSTEAVLVDQAFDVAPGPYTVTLETSQTAVGPDPNHAADLLAVFEFQVP